MIDRVQPQGNANTSMKPASKRLWQGTIKGGTLRIVEVTQSPDSTPPGTPPLVMRVVERAIRQDAMGNPVWEVWDGIDADDVMALINTPPPVTP